MKNIIVMGLKISRLKKQEIFAKINEYLNSNRAHFLTTLNPEILLAAQKDKDFFYILNEVDLQLVDGFGSKLACLFSGANLPRLTGADLVEHILRIAEETNLTVGITNWIDGLSSNNDIEVALKKRYSKLKFQIEARDRKVGETSDLKCDILFVNLGAPWQEKFIYHNQSKIENLKLAIGVGGSFDFLTGKIKRAPQFIRFIGLEWLWRLFQQPWRWIRMLNAVVIFPVKLLYFKFKKN